MVETIYIIGRIESIIKPITDDARHRYNILVDGIRAERFQDGVVDQIEPSDFYLVRIMSTRGRFRTPIYEFLKWGIGAWVQLALSQNENCPRVWIVTGENGYEGHVEESNLIKATLLLPQSGQNAAIKDNAAAQQVLKFGEVNKIRKANYLDMKIDDPLHEDIKNLCIRVIDVGQASCNALQICRDDPSIAIGYFDVGMPIFFHAQSFPTAEAFAEGPNVPDSGFVILSHWDFDHYSLAIKRLEKLQKLEWYVPLQSSFSPSAIKLLKSIEKVGKINFVNGSHIALTRRLTIMKCSGPQSDPNSSGLVLQLQTDRGNVLLTGDAGYDFIPSMAKKDLIGLTVPHHGGLGEGIPPSPKEDQSVAAISYGIPNKYGHPRETTITDHSLWEIKRTINSGTRIRGSIILP